MPEIDAQIEAGAIVLVTVKAGADPRAPRAPEFTYTVGLEALHRHPELMVAGQSESAAARLLGSAVARIEAGARLPLDTPVLGLLPDLAVVFKPISPTVAAIVLQAAALRAQRPPRALQLAWADHRGYYPWHSGFDRKLRPLAWMCFDPPKAPEP